MKGVQASQGRKVPKRPPGLRIAQLAPSVFCALACVYLDLSRLWGV